MKTSTTLRQNLLFTCHPLDANSMSRVQFILHYKEGRIRGGISAFTACG
jgi:hypothetical protein